MYLHLGGDIVVNTKDIIGIFDIENSSIGKGTKEFFARMQKSGNVINVSTELPKSFVLINKGDKSTLYISQISSATLLKRTGYIDFISNV